MIVLHRLGHAVEAFHLNPDLILTVEANPDTVITLINGHKIVVAEPPERVARDHARYRTEVLAAAMALRDEQRDEELADDRSVVRRFPSRPGVSATGTAPVRTPEGLR